jgi:hypothetical protein
MGLKERAKACLNHGSGSILFGDIGLKLEHLLEQSLREGDA